MVYFMKKNLYWFLDLGVPHVSKPPCAIHPILGIITMGILNPIDGCMTIPFYVLLLLLCTNYYFQYHCYHPLLVDSWIPILDGQKTVKDGGTVEVRKL